MVLTNDIRDNIKILTKSSSNRGVINTDRGEIYDEHTKGRGEIIGISYRKFLILFVT